MTKGAEREKEAENLFEETVTEEFPNLKREINIQILEDQRSPDRLIMKIYSPRHIITKVSKIKDKETILKAVREK